MTARDYCDPRACVQVSSIRGSVSLPVVECVTREQRVCHTSYVTEYTPVTVRGYCVDSE